MVQISLQNSGGKVVFYGWVPRNPPWTPTGVKVPWSLKCLYIDHVTCPQLIHTPTHPHPLILPTHTP